MAEISYEIVKQIGVISGTSKGWTKELNFISWNGRGPKFDIREWSPDHQTMSKGITFNVEEMRSLRDLLNSLEL